MELGASGCAFDTLRLEVCGLWLEIHMQCTLYRGAMACMWARLVMEAHGPIDCRSRSKAIREAYHICFDILRSKGEGGWKTPLPVIPPIQLKIP